MHEMSIAVELLQQVEALAAEHRAGRVEALEIAAGSLRAVVPEALDLAWQELTAGTLAEGSALMVRPVPPRVRCRGCGHTFAPEPDAYLCDRCGLADVEILEGNDIMLMSLTFTPTDGEASHED
jgi:hydrogenase nickel incorporation protein HypA/HybF